MTIHPRSLRFASRRTAPALVAGLVGLLFAAPVSAQTAADLYTQVLAQETAVRAAASATLTDLRGLEKAYEAIVLKYPASAYSDNALWQGAGVLISAFERFRDPADEQRAQQLLEWLQKEYPSSSLVKKAVAALEDLRTASSPRPDGKALASNVPTPVPAGSPAAIRSVTRTPLPRGERVTIEFSQEVSFAGDRISGPDRVYFDFRNSAMNTAVADRALTGAGAVIKSLKVAPHDLRTTRLVLELADSPRYSVFRMYDPFRLVIDVETDAPAQTAPSTTGPTAPAPAATEAAQSVAASPAASRRLDADAPAPSPPPPAPIAAPVREVARVATSESPASPAITSRGDYSLGRQLGLGVSRVVIDPGHGGHDPGAQSNGIDESELVLDVALRVEKLLRDDHGFDVVLTRRTDEFIPLEERTAIANRECADLFLSIHANASREPAARGIETYFLNFATTPAAEAVAARENATSTRTMGNLPELVKAITLNNKVAESREMATIVQSSLTRKLTTQTRPVRDLGVKQAPFVVLIGAQMPSVLAEISFVTNRPEALLLKQAAYRQKIAQALFDAIVKYRASLKKTTAVAAKGDGK